MIAMSSASAAKRLARQSCIAADSIGRRRASIASRHRHGLHREHPVTNSARRERFSTADKPKSKTNAAGDDELPPLPVSPLKARQKYLESKKKVEGAKGDHVDVHARIQQLNAELDAVRERNINLVEKQVNKPAWRKLVDPLHRYRHSLYNMMAVTLAYILAHRLHAVRNEQKQTQALLDESTKDQEELKRLLASLLADDALSGIASSCAEAIADGDDSEISESNVSSKIAWFFSSTPGARPGYLEDLDRQERLQDKLKPAIRQQLQKLIGDALLSKEDRDEKQIQAVVEESRTRAGEIADDPERLLRQVLASDEQEVTTDAQGNEVVKKRAFSL